MGTAKRTVIGGRYELDTFPLGRGGMGEVYTGYDTKLDRKVAVKLIRFPYGEHDDTLVKRFLHEARIMARLEHPGIPAIHDADLLTDGRPYLVMQFVEGITVHDLVAEQEKLPPTWAAAIAAQVAAVLHAAHERGIFHRDLKPSNLMLLKDGSVKVLDFGLAMFHDPDLSKLTRTGTLLGTPSYMSPEQIREATVGPQSDLYSLGLVLHEMLTGRRVFDGETEFRILERQVNEPPPPIDGELGPLIAKLLEKKAEDRPARAEDVYRALLPFTRPLGPLPGVVTDEPSALRMYAGVVGNVAPTGTSAKPSTPAPADVTFSPDDIARARSEAEELVKDSRYGQAVEVLDAVVGPAEQALGSLDDRVLDLRRHRAEILFADGDYHRAAPAFRSLHTDLTRKYTPDHDDVFYCRTREATCQALIGETGRALRLLTDLLADEERVYGPDDDRPLTLRRQIGLLQLGAGDTDRARATLSALHADLTRLRGPNHPETVRVRESLKRTKM